MAKSKSRLVAEYMRNIQEAQDGTIQNAEVELVKNSTPTNLYAAEEIDAMFDDIIAGIETIAIASGA